MKADVQSFYGIKARQADIDRERALFSPKAGENIDVFCAVRYCLTLALSCTVQYMCVLQEKRPHLLLLRLRSSLVRGGGSQSVRDTWRDPTTKTSGPGGMGRKEKQEGESPNALVGNMIPSFFCHKAGRSTFLRCKVGKSHNSAVPYIRRGRIGRSAIPSLRKKRKNNDASLLPPPLSVSGPPSHPFPFFPLPPRCQIELGRRAAAGFSLSLFLAASQYTAHTYNYRTSATKKGQLCPFALESENGAFYPPSCVPFCPICAVCIVGKKALSVSSSPPLTPTNT